MLLAIAMRVCETQPRDAKFAHGPPMGGSPIVHVRQGAHVADRGLFCAVLQGDFGKCGPCIKRQGGAWWTFDGHQITNRPDSQTNLIRSLRHLLWHWHLRRVTSTQYTIHSARIRINPYPCLFIPHHSSLVAFHIQQQQQPPSLAPLRPNKPSLGFDAVLTSPLNLQQSNKILNR